MFTRNLQKTLLANLQQQPAVALIGPRQAGKTTLALEMTNQLGGIYLDLENPHDRAKLADPLAYLEGFADRLIILDEIHRFPEIFEVLRGLIDRGRRGGKKNGRFLLLGSASLDVSRKGGETLAGRIRYLELTPLLLSEVGETAGDKLWLRGGYPESFLSPSEETSLDWREDLIRTYLEREVALFGPRIPIETLRRLWMMLAHNQGGVLNSAKLASALDISAQTVNRYGDLLADLFLIRRLIPFHRNTKKRLVKSPKIYVRDSGLLHALLRILDRDNLLGHPVVGGSWEGFVIEQIIARAPPRVIPSFYCTGAGAEIDLLLEFPPGELWAIEIKRGLATPVSRGFHSACADLNPTKKFRVHGGQDTAFPVGNGVMAISLAEITRMIAGEQG